MRDAERFAKLITLENGKALPIRGAKSPTPPSSSAGMRRKPCAIIGEVSRAPASGARIFVHHKPAGIAVLVTPWNFPAAMATRKIGPALAAGCPVVLKPASDTPLTMLALMPALEEAGVPAGVVNVIPSRSSGKVVGAMLHDPRVRVVPSPVRPKSAASCCMRPPTILSSRRWSLAEMRHSLCSKTPTSMQRSTAP